MSASANFSRFRARLDDANHMIYRIEQETGLSLVQYIIEDDGFRYDGQNYIAELMPQPDGQLAKPHYVCCKWDESKAWDYGYYLSERLGELNWQYEQRKAFLPQAQEIWKRLAKYNKDVQIHYGLRSVWIRIPLEVLVACEAYIDASAAFRGEIIDFSIGSRCYADFGFKWTDVHMLAFENRVDYLDWKFSTQDTAQKIKENLIEFVNFTRYFSRWEEQVFCPPASAPL